MSEARHLDDLGSVQLCCECLVLNDGEALMFKRSEKASKFPGYWIGSGGHIDEGEDPLLAAIREVFEETGVRVDMQEIKLKGVQIGHHLDKKEIWVSFIFLAKISKHQIEKKNDVEGRTEWIPIEKLLSMEEVFPPSKYCFDHVLNDKPGIMYTNIQWDKMELVRVLSERVDING